jgi:diacylglycerol kinase family enzyme
LIADSFIILNPTANHNKAQSTWENVKSQLESNSIPYQLRITRMKSHATNIIFHHLITTYKKNKLPKNIVIIGGDGTINEVLTGIIRAINYNRNLPKIPVVIIPAGEDNIFAKKINLNHNNIVTKLKNPHIENHYIGIFNEQMKNQIGVFINKMNVGLDTSSLDYPIISYHWLKKCKNLFSIFSMIYNLSPFPIIIDDNKQIKKINNVFQSTAINDPNTDNVILKILSRKNFFQLIYIMICIIIRGSTNIKNVLTLKQSFIHIEISSLEYSHTDNEGISSQSYSLNLKKIKYPFIK